MADRAFAAEVSSRAVRPIVAGLHAHGIDPEPLLRDVGIAPTTLADVDSTVPHEQAIALWHRAIRASGDPHFGLHVAQAIDPAQFDVLSYVVLTSANLRDGLERICRYHRLQHSAAEVTLRSYEGEVGLSHRLPGGRRLPQPVSEFVAGVWMNVCRAATGVAWEPRQVRFSGTKPEQTRVLDDYFRAPLRFDAGETVVVFPSDVLELPHRSADPRLVRVLDQHASSLLERLPTITSFSDKVRSLIASELQGGNPSAEAIAERLHLSVRTLSRRLAEEGHAYKELLAELRKELATDYLRDPRMEIAEVAFLLGFSEPSAFFRAFKRWYGETPTVFRQRMLP
ncbi:MAG: AraC family transcriptional regulator [Myxococcales bacterium FL481]|nr:MAG: AraC family transcriptional regulator [Myxococcales bacterium FL481]